MRVNLKSTLEKSKLFTTYKSSRFSDSLFLDNCFTSAADLKNVKKSLPEDQITYIYDNEPRNREIIKHMYIV